MIYICVGTVMLNDATLQKKRKKTVYRQANWSVGRNRLLYVSKNHFTLGYGKSEVATSWVSHNNIDNDVSLLYFWVECLTSERMMIIFNESANFTV